MYKKNSRKLLIDVNPVSALQRLEVTSAARGQSGGLGLLQWHGVTPMVRGHSGTLRSLQWLGVNSVSRFTLVAWSYTGGCIVYVVQYWSFYIHFPKACKVQNLGRNNFQNKLTNHREVAWKDMLFQAHIMQINNIFQNQQIYAMKG
jgi:hypothetical protein